MRGTWTKLIVALARRSFLQLSAGAALMAAPRRKACAETARPLADRLADYADAIGFADLDAATIERVKSHLIDTLGCGIAALDEPRCASAAMPHLPQRAARRP